MSWDALDDDELRNLPAQLIAARRWDDLRGTVLDSGYLRAVVSRLDLLALNRILGETVDGPEVPAALAARCAELREVMVEEASFLAAPQYTGLAGAFRNHLDVALARRGHLDEWAATAGDAAELGQEGWLDLVAQSGRTMPPATRFFMPGRRESYVADIAYDSGPYGVRTSVAIDLTRMRLLGETISYSYNELDHYYPTGYNWRIWDVRSGALLLDQFHHDATRRPPAFDAPDLARGERRRLPSQDSPAGHFTELKINFGSANGPEQLFAGKDGDGRLRCVVTDHQRQRVLVDVTTTDTVEPRLMITLDDRFVLFGIGGDDHIYRVDLDEEPIARPSMRVPSPLPEDDPVVGLGLTWDSHKHAFTSRFVRSPHAPFTYVASTAEPPHQLDRPSSWISRMTDSSEGMFLLPGGLVVEKLTTSIAVWESATGRWLGNVAATRSSRGADSLLRGGVAATPDGRHLISANSLGPVCWNIDQSEARGDVPDWTLGGIALPDPVTRLAVLDGGRLVAAVTESHELLVLRFEAESAILARIGLDEEVVGLVTDPHGTSITCVGRSGALSTYRFRYLSAPTT